VANCRRRRRQSGKSLKWLQRGCDPRTEIAGIVLATILARHGLKVLMIDSGSHPRFAVGEATTPQMTSLLKLLAVRYLRHDDLH
jgi:hypothetical protein